MSELTSGDPNHKASGPFRGDRLHPAWAAIALVEIAAIVYFGLLTVFNFQIWAPIDEGAHYDYIKTVAERRRLPVLGVDRTSSEVAAIHQKVYPGKPKPPPDPPGLGDYVYEAFQPPLYYIVASPAFLISDNYLEKVTWVRAFNFVLLLAGVAVAYLLCRDVYPEKTVQAFVFIAAALLVPGVVVRNVTISNAALEIPVVLALGLFLWRVYSKPGRANLIAAGVAMGVCLLTKLTLAYMIPVFLLAVAAKAFRERNARTWAACAGSLLIPPLLLAPWLAFNQTHFDAFTSNAVAKKMQYPIINPDKHSYPSGELPMWISAMADAIVPQEWGAETARPGIGAIRDFLKVSWFMLPAVIGVFAWKRLRVWRLALFAPPLILNLGLLSWQTVSQDFNLMGGRYLYAAIPLWLAAAFGVYSRIDESDLITKTVGGVSAGGLLWAWFALASWRL